MHPLISCCTVGGIVGGLLLKDDYDEWAVNHTL